MEHEPTVFVVDDDQPVRKALGLLMKSVRLRVETYASAQEFLGAYDPARPGCLVLDVRMPGMDGLELQEKLTEQNIRIPVIVITGHGDVPMAVQAVRKGALDFFEKPFREQVLLERINQAIEMDARERRISAARQAIEARIANLPPKEREVLDLVVTGKANKQIAAQLHISCKAVEARRAKVMAKMQAESLAELVRMVLAAER